MSKEISFNTFLISWFLFDLLSFHTSKNKRNINLFILHFNIITDFFQLSVMKVSDKSVDASET